MKWLKKTNEKITKYILASSRVLPGAYNIITEWIRWDSVLFVFSEFVLFITQSR